MLCDPELSDASLGSLLPHGNEPRPGNSNSSLKDGLIPCGEFIGRVQAEGRLKCRT